MPFGQRRFYLRKLEINGALNICAAQNKRERERERGGERRERDTQNES
jgi:hypothetical protein